MQKCTQLIANGYPVHKTGNTADHWSVLLILTERVTLLSVSLVVSLALLLAELDCEIDAEEIILATRSRCSTAAELISVFIVCIRDSVVTSPPPAALWLSRCWDIAASISDFMSELRARSLASSPRWNVYNKHSHNHHHHHHHHHIISICSSINQPIHLFVEEI